MAHHTEHAPATGQVVPPGGFPISQIAIVVKDIAESGNTSAASIPLALSKLVERREIPSGAPVLLFGFGGGLTYSGQVVRCP